MTVKTAGLPQEVRQGFEELAGLPAFSRNAYMRVLRDAGWPLERIAESIGDLTRERVRQCVKETPTPEASQEILRLADAGVVLEIPEVPIRPPVERPARRVRPLPSSSDLVRLRELKPLAASVRYSHGKHREEAEEYVSLLWKVHKDDGVSVYRLGKLLDILPSAIESRFVRYGFKETVGLSGNYVPIKYRKTRT